VVYPRYARPGPSDGLSVKPGIEFSALPIDRRNELASALSGIKVLDLAGLGPSSIAAMMLGDMGAEVLKIDLPPGGGSRGVGDGLPFFPESDEETEKMTAYMATNRNKKNMALNLRTEAGQQVFHKLAKEYDVIIEAFRPGVMDRMNVGYQAVSATNPRIIFCSVSGYGQTGPYKTFPGHDANYAGMGGVLGLTGESRDGAPVIALNVVADIAIAVLQAVIGILLAVCARERTGRGQHVDISMTDGVVSLLIGVPGGGEYFYNGVLPQRGDTMTSGTLPFYSVYEAKDKKYLTMCPIEPRFWGNLCRAIGREEFGPQQFDPNKKDEIYAELRRIFLTRTRDEWFEMLTQADVPVGKVLELDELFSDPQVLHRQMVVDVDHPKFGKVKQIGIGIKLSDTPGEIRSLGAVLGKHTQEVMAGVGYSQAEIDELRSHGVVY
jgi:crotonobetainyl-CoA:carnitine CoA-transferase CaiB-like acyl-CoA transferase